jgi:hypothetical protein
VYELVCSLVWVAFFVNSPFLAWIGNKEASEEGRGVTGEPGAYHPRGSEDNVESIAFRG